MKHFCLLACWLALCAGCQQKGYILSSTDVLATPGQEIQLEVQLEKRNLRDQPGRTIEFYLGEQPYGSAQTDHEGYARIAFRPEEPKDYVFDVKLVMNGSDEKPPPPCQLLVACRTSDTPMMIVDLDSTLVAGSFSQVLFAKPPPMPDSQAVMKQFAEHYTIIYLTHRLTELSHRSRQWLIDQGYPQGPLLLAPTSQLLCGSRKYKTRVINDLRQRFSKIEIGIGDKISDVRAYQDNGMQAYLLLPNKGLSPLALADLLRRLGNLTDPVQVVTDWKEIEQGVLGNGHFPPERLKKKASGSGPQAPGTATTATTATAAPDFRPQATGTETTTTGFRLQTAGYRNGNDNDRLQTPDLKLQERQRQ